MNGSSTDPVSRTLNWGGNTGKARRAQNTDKRGEISASLLRQLFSCSTDIHTLLCLQTGIPPLSTLARRTSLPFAPRYARTSHVLPFFLAALLSDHASTKSGLFQGCISHDSCHSHSLNHAHHLPGHLPSLLPLPPLPFLPTRQATIAAERAMGFTHSHNSETNWDSWISSSTLSTATGTRKSNSNTKVEE